MISSLDDLQHRFTVPYSPRVADGTGCERLNGGLTNSCRRSQPSKPHRIPPPHPPAPAGLPTVPGPSS